jgi:short-subunit dehydrogenase
MSKKVVLITGASSGIGKETAKLLLEDGYIVYGASRNLEKMRDIEKMGVNIIQMDVSKDESMVKGIDRILVEQGRIDILVNNAGYGSYGALEDVPLNEARYQFEVNVFGLARLTQLVLPRMREQRSGKIINISSVGGSFGEPHGSWYHATKFAVEGLSDSLRMELKQFGIDVIVIKPGAIKTEWNTIARENLLRVSGNTDYGILARKQARLYERTDKNATEPFVIAKVIQKAVRSRRPKTRYVKGKMAGLILASRNLLPDRTFDRMYLSMIS